MFSFDINVPLHCIDPNYNYYHNVVATNVGGPVLIFTLAALAVCLRIRKPVLENDGQLKLLGFSITYISLLLSYMVLPAVSTATLKLFSCKDFRPDGGPFVLVDDMSVECGTATHTAYIVFGVVMMLSPIGGAVDEVVWFATFKSMAHI